MQVPSECGAAVRAPRSAVTQPESASGRGVGSKKSSASAGVNPGLGKELPLESALVHCVESCRFCDDMGCGQCVCKTAWQFVVK